MREIKTVVIAGAGLMGASIAQSFPVYGCRTILYTVEDGTGVEFKRAKEIIAQCQNTLVENGVLSKEKSEYVLQAIEYTLDMSCFGEADWIIEAIPEQMESKALLLKNISEIAPKETIVSSNTSAIAINDLAQYIENPERFCGTHWLNPPHIIPLVELTKGEETSDETIELLYQFLLSMEKQPVRLKKDVKGFLSNRLQFALLREATYLVESGVADPEDIDRTLRYGNGLRYMCSGPFKIVDFGGIHVFESVAKYLYPDLNCEKEQNKLLSEMAQKGIDGISNGQGFYQYSKESAVWEEKERDKAMILAIKNSIK